MRHRFTAIVRAQKGPPNPDYGDPDLQIWDLTFGFRGRQATIEYFETLFGTPVRTRPDPCVALQRVMRVFRYYETASGFDSWALQAGFNLDFVDDRVDAAKARARIDADRFKIRAFFGDQYEWAQAKAVAGTLAKWCRGQDFLP